MATKLLIYGESIWKDL